MTLTPRPGVCRDHEGDQRQKKRQRARQEVARLGGDHDWRLIGIRDVWNDVDEQATRRDGTNFSLSLTNVRAEKNLPARPHLAAAVRELRLRTSPAARYADAP